MPRAFDPARLRLGEWLVGASAILLLAMMFAVKWFGPGVVTGRTYTPTSVNGWHALIHLRWLLLVTIVASLGLALLQGTRPAPALPATMSLIVTLLGLVTLVWVGYRVLISVPPNEKAGAFLGLACTIGIVVGGYLSLRQEGIARRDEPKEIPTVRLGGETDS